MRVKCLAQERNTMSLAKDIVLYSIKLVGVFLLPNPSQGYPQHTIHWKAQLGGEMHLAFHSLPPILYQSMVSIQRVYQPTEGKEDKPQVYSR